MIQMHGVGGGNQTLLPMLHNWIERNKQILKKSGSDPLAKALDEIRQSKDLAQTDVPSEFETLASQMVKAMWQQALSVSDTKVQMGRIETLEEENDRLRLQLMDYQEVKAKLAGMELAYKHVLEQMQLVVRNNERLVKLGDSKEVNDFLEEINRLQKQIEKLSSANQLLQNRVADADAIAQQTSELNTTLSTVSQERDKLNIQVTQLAERNRELLLKSQRLEATLASKLNEIDELKAQLVAQPLLPSAPVFGTENTSEAQTIQALTERNQFLENQLKELYDKFGKVQKELVLLREGGDSEAVPQDKTEVDTPAQSAIIEASAPAASETVTKPVQNQTTKSRTTRKKSSNK